MKKGKTDFFSKSYINNKTNLEFCKYKAWLLDHVGL